MIERAWPWSRSYSINAGKSTTFPCYTCSPVARGIAERSQERAQMGRPKKGQAKEPPTVAVKIDRTLASKARLIAADLGVPLADYLSGALGTVVERDWAKLIRRVGD